MACRQFLKVAEVCATITPMSDLVTPPDASPDAPPWNLADRLEKARKHARVSVGEMADYLGVSPGTVHNWTSGRIRPKVQTLRLWAIRCGVPYAWLETGTGTTWRYPENLCPRRAAHPRRRSDCRRMPMVECGRPVERYVRARDQFAPARTAYARVSDLATARRSRAKTAAMAIPKLAERGPRLRVIK